MGYDISAVAIAGFIVYRVFKDGKVSGKGEITLLCIASAILGSTNLVRGALQWVVQFVLDLFASLITMSFPF